MKYTLRSATEDDYQALCSLFDEGDALHRQHHPELFCEPPDGVSRPQDHISNLIEDSSSLLLVAEEDGKLVGAIVAHIREAPPFSIMTPRRFGSVENIIVRQEYRGQGIGWTLMQAAEQWAMSKGAQSMELNVYLFNEPAIRLYESLGYTAISQKMSKPL